LNAEVIDIVFKIAQEEPNLGRVLLQLGPAAHEAIIPGCKGRVGTLQKIRIQVDIKSRQCGGLGHSGGVVPKGRW
jgi:hypothetical protein